MITVTCDHCKKPITEVAYALSAIGADLADLQHRALSRTHLHWDCLPHFGRLSKRAEPA